MCVSTITVVRWTAGRKALAAPAPPCEIGTQARASGWLRNSDPRVTTLLLAVTGIEVLVLFGAGVGLLVQPAVIGSIWPWPLTPFNAAFLGAVYSASLVAPPRSPSSDAGRRPGSSCR